MKACVGNESCCRGLGSAIVTTVKNGGEIVSKVMRTRLQKPCKDRIECLDNNSAGSEFGNLLRSGTRHAYFKARRTQWIHAADESLSFERPGDRECIFNGMPGNCQKEDIRKARRVLRRTRSRV